MWEFSPLEASPGRAGHIATVLCLLAILLLLTVAAATFYEVKLEAEACSAASPSLLARLGANWQELSRYAQDCPIPAADGTIALKVVIVRIDRMQQQHWRDGHPDLHIPLPILLDKQSRVVGTLPEGFPADLPGALRVTFRNWHGGMPGRIDLFESFETALPPHALAPQVWDAARHLYRPLPDKP